VILRAAQPTGAGEVGRHRSANENTLAVTQKVAGSSKTRTVEITPRLAAEINERRKRSHSEYLFPNINGKPDQHLLRDLQDLAKKARAKFHTELHKLRKTGAGRRYLKGVPLPTLMQELGHESLATTQDYLADVRREDEAKKAAADAYFVPKPRLVSGTDGD
jgi:integrase